MFQEGAAAFASTNRLLLHSLGPPGSNISFPVAPALEHNFTVGKIYTVVEDFAALHADFSGWLLSVGNLGFLLLLLDYFHRCFSSVRMFVRFWSRASLGMSDADLRIDKKASGATTIAKDTDKVAARVILNPLTMRGGLWYTTWPIFMCPSACRLSRRVHRENPGRLMIL